MVKIDICVPLPKCINSQIINGWKLNKVNSKQLVINVKFIRYNQMLIKLKKFKKLHKF